MAETQLTGFRFPTLKSVDYIRQLEERGLLKPPFFNISDAGAAPSTMDELIHLGRALTELTSLARTELTYADRRGDEALRVGIASHLAPVNPHLSAEQCLIFSGAQEAIFAVAAQLLSPSDEVIVFTPGYQPLIDIGQVVGARCRTIALECSEARGWYYPLDRLEAVISKRTRLICVNQPHNPTGAVLNEEDIARLHRIVDSGEHYLLTDEVSILSDFKGLGVGSLFMDHPRVISVGVCSKSLGLSGLRIGWALVNDVALYRQLLDVKAYTSICGSRLDEWLMTALLKRGDALIQRNNAIISKNVEHINAVMQAHGERLRWHEPAAGVVGYIEWCASKSYEHFLSFLKRALVRHRLLMLPSYCFCTERLPFFRIGLGSCRLDQKIPSLIEALIADDID